MSQERDPDFGTTGIAGWVSSNLNVSLLVSGLRVRLLQRGCLVEKGLLFVSGGLPEC